MEHAKFLQLVKHIRELANSPRPCSDCGKSITAEDSTIRKTLKGDPELIKWCRNCSKHMPIQRLD